MPHRDESPESSDGRVDAAEDTHTGGPAAQVNGSTPIVAPAPSTGSSEVEARLRGIENRLNSLESAGQGIPVIRSALPTITQRVTELGRTVEEHHTDLYDLDNRFRDFSVDVDEINEYHGLSHPDHRARDTASSPTSQTSSPTPNTSNMDQASMPEGVARQITWLAARVNHLTSILQRPNSNLINHIDNLTDRVNQVTANQNTIGADVDARFAALTNGLTTHIQRLKTLHDTSVMELNRRIDHQTLRFERRIDRLGDTFRAQIETVIGVVDDLTTQFNRLHVEDLSVTVQQHTSLLQELSNRITHMNESFHQELENIRANTHAAVAMQVSRHRNSAASSSVQDNIAPRAPAAAQVSFQQIPPAPPSTPDTTSEAPLPMPFTLASTAPPSTFDTLSPTTRAQVMRNDIGLSRIMTSDDSYWAPRQVAARAAATSIAASAVSTANNPPTNDQRVRLFQERSARAGIRVSAPPSMAAVDRDTSVYSSLDQFEAMEEERSRGELA
ncbi:MAG: hypothetical protein Q9166_007722 [cf. Caloplaca sp. 2 TL-2023]